MITKQKYFILLILLLTSAYTMNAQGTDFYWESQSVLSQHQAAYPQLLDTKQGLLVIWQENIPAEYSGSAYLSFVKYKNDGTVESRNKFAGPFIYEGVGDKAQGRQNLSAPVLFSTAMNDDKILIAVSANENTINIYESSTDVLSFKLLSSINLTTPAVVPRIFPRAGGGWQLFVTRSQKFSRKAEHGDISYESLSMFYSQSDDGKSWDSFVPFLSGELGLDPNFLPTTVSLDNKDIVVFQSLTGSNRPTYQLYSTTKNYQDQNWSKPTLITDFVDATISSRNKFQDFDNQRPNLLVINGEIFLTWERKYLSGAYQVYFAKLNNDGKLISGTVEKITENSGSCFEPRLFYISTSKGLNPAVCWCDDRGGKSQLYFAFKDDKTWHEINPVPQSKQGQFFGRAAHTKAGLYLFWQGGLGDHSTINTLLPDISVSAPYISPSNFEIGKASRRSYITVKWNEPYDSSGIRGFSYLWSQDENAEPPKQITALSNITSASFEAESDGTWYFSIRAQDYAGNWSKANRLVFTRDSTPPAEPVLIPIAASNDGFIASSSFNIHWTPPPDKDLAGYTWTLEYLGPLENKSPASSTNNQAYDMLPSNSYESKLWPQAPINLSPVVLTKKPEISFDNIENGYWIFAVAAIDVVGNIGPAAKCLVRNNKFKPYTLVSDVIVKRDDFGKISLSLIGRGFSTDGLIKKIILSNTKPKATANNKDYEYNLSDGDYSIVSDRLLELHNLSNVEAGTYNISLYHSKRNIYSASKPLYIEYSGTIKFGDRGNNWSPSWVFLPIKKTAINQVHIAILAAIILPAIGIILSFRHLLKLTAELKMAKYEAIALLEGKAMPALKRKKLANQTIRRGRGLTSKFAFTISILVIFVVLIVSMPLGFNMRDTQKDILARSLEQRVRVLLESAAQSGIAYLPSKSVIELSLALNQTGAIPEAKYMTISAYGNSSGTNSDVVWATNDPDISGKIDTRTLTQGVSILTDSLTPKIKDISESINVRGKSELSSLSDTLQELRREAMSLAANLDPVSQTKFNTITSHARRLEKEIKENIAIIADESVSSEPAFIPTQIGVKAEDYIFFKPIVYSLGNDGIYYRGLVRLCVSTKTIVEQIQLATARLIRTIAIITVIAFLVGVIGALVLSRIIINPLMKVVKGIEVIRDESDKKKLANFSITIKSKDEIAILADTINGMTVKLVEAAREADFLTIGKEVQKMFIPLITNKFNEKLTTGFDDNPTHIFFGYYEGAKGVSGDYFDYRKLDERFWAFIKCDVSGKGVPAALIMVGVATIFTTELNDWSFKHDGIHLDKITYKINDFIEQRGFSGRFAAFIMGIYDSQTGDVYLCHAGDNLVRVYDSQQNEVVTHTLKQAPTAGTFSNDMVKIASPYTQVSIKLQRGDSLLLYTDGFEEASRTQRDNDFNSLYKEKVLENKDASYKEFLVEQFGEERIKLITEAIMSKSFYTLKKENDPLGTEFVYEFDFSKLDADAESLVMGLAAVEKVFRLIPDPLAGPDDLVIVDAKIDNILSKCWKQYSRFCYDKRAHHDEHKTEYIYYGHLKEDEQYDDLTMMLIQRK